ncbi:hypothetical protein [Leyella stercorea]|uniref:hypothetical protein n=1 Tax=Leyella stercorea TaxID=363265 RepID=UPI00266D9A83|nr:hypothetical protein [Leyella stercorea]
MFRLGYLDDDKGIRTTFARQFGNDFEIVMFQDMDKISSLEDLLNALEEKHLDALAVDYLLSGNGLLPYNGDEVVSFLEEHKKFFPVFMVTSHVGDALDKMNDVFLVNDKEDLSVENLRLNLIDKVKKAIESYHRRVDSIEDKARELEDKQKSEVGLTNEEEQLLLKLHMELNSIDSKANPVSAELLQTSSLKNLAELVKNSRTLLDSIK